MLDKAGAAFAQDADYVAYYSTLANTLREYLTARFGFPAFALTTTEMQDQMVRRGMDRWQARIVGGLLNQCDAVVYARYRPAAERADADLTAAYEIVEMSPAGRAHARRRGGARMRLADPICPGAAHRDTGTAVPARTAAARRLRRLLRPRAAGGHASYLARALPLAADGVQRHRPGAAGRGAGAGRRKGRPRRELPGQGIDVVLVLDTSSSMSSSMGKASRLETSQKVIQDFIKGRKEDRVGLVIFRESSLVLSPMTLDYQALGDLVGRVERRQPAGRYRDRRRVVGRAEPAARLEGAQPRRGAADGR